MGFTMTHRNVQVPLLLCNPAVYIFCMLGAEKLYGAANLAQPDFGKWSQHWFDSVSWAFPSKFEAVGSGAFHLMDAGDTGDPLEAKP